MMSRTGGTLIFEIPTAATLLSKVFSQMDASREKFDIEDWGVSNTSRFKHCIAMTVFPGADDSVYVCLCVCHYSPGRGVCANCNGRIRCQ